MKNSTTIWESASRPLFVRTVWLESSELRRGLQRHFLLDYDTKRPLQILRSAVNPLQERRKSMAFLHFVQMQIFLHTIL